ncbi:ATP-binding protein [Rathayibacter sp. AY1C9]|uniref:ATP-binding protein n=1 Tax=Rathayibacter sp. AY1C9 TaxID=2080541 RepID=UPI000CE8B930|nr:ATP-binding protein [Rathayibacter sp. AY1C9]PPH44046.1 ATP-binding protein [Rathayibacter sp. AY1C9]
MTERSVGFRTPPDDTEVVHEMLAGLWGERPDLPARDRMAVETALVELVDNVIQHATSTTTIVCRIVVRVEGDAIHAELVDTADPPDIGTGPREMPDVFAESGRGLALIQALTTTFEHERSEGRNVWTLTRALDS